MQKRSLFITLVAATLLGIIACSYINPTPKNTVTGTSADFYQLNSVKTALLADGCFWCVESDLQKVPGVTNVISGYAGGTGKNPTYENYAEEGFKEVVEVTYDPKIVTYGNLVEHILKHGDPTDPDGSFVDRGPQYAPAIYYQSEEEKIVAQDVIKKADQLKVFEKPIAIKVVPIVTFFPAEDYHQDYSVKNPVHYSYYRGRSGRSDFIEKYWKNNATKFTISTTPSSENKSHLWKNFVKPDSEILKNKLTAEEYAVTQKSGTEKPFINKYDKFNEEGIYVDILSGEPLYSSNDKFDSGTGWPSFVKPITPGAVVLKADSSLFTTRTEVRSSFGDNHLGHVFEDGPKDRGGKRYCMNSAALRFIPKSQMEKDGYGDYLK